MNGEPEFSVERAREAAGKDELRGWVAGFLGSPGSDNPVLAEKLTGELRWWEGPVLIRLDELHRLAGPPGDPVLCEVDDEYWDDRVDDMESVVEHGSQLPPVVVACRNGHFVLEDGNHRVEGFRQAGKRVVWAVVGFARGEERDRFNRMRSTGSA